MDKNTVTGLVLIGAVLVAFMFLNKPSEDNSKIQSEQNNTSLNQPTNNKAVVENDKVEYDSTPDNPIDSVISERITNQLIAEQSIEEQKELMEVYGLFYKAVNGEEKSLALQNDKIKLHLSSKGAKITSVDLIEKDPSDSNDTYLYRTYDAAFEDSINEPLTLFEKENSDFYISLQDVNNPGISIKSRDFYFDVIEQSDSLAVFRAYADSTRYLDFTYRLSKGKYDVDFVIDYHGIGNEISPDVDLNWFMRGLSTERLADDERMTCSVMYGYAGKSRDYISERSSKEEEIDGKLNWVAFKHKFFSSILISEDGFKSGKIGQDQMEDEDEFIRNEYTIDYIAKGLSIPSRDQVKLTFFFGPNDYDLLATYGKDMKGIVNLGWGIFGWVNEFLIGPIFHFIKSWGIGYGLVILLLTLAVKIIILPLTYKNYMSSAKMKVLKPEIAKINDKYEGKTDKNAAMKKQQETMALYKQTGVNPMAGCIPVVIQMPILFAVFRYFPSSLDLRHQGFLWAEDLSSFDSILELGFNIPFYGDHISLFTLLMAASTLFYTMTNSNQMTPSPQPGMPNMKVIMYMFPIMMIFFFNTYSSGLSYYYLCGNLMNMGIMWAIKKYMVDEDKIRLQIESNKKKPKKKSRFQQRMDDIAKQQQKKRG